MTQVYVKYNPYRLSTEIKVNGNAIPTDSSLYKVTEGKRLQEWIGKFPEMLRQELNTSDFSLEFYGMDLDWDDFEEAFKQAQDQGIVRISNMSFIEGKSDEDINEKIVNVFHDLQNGPIEAFRNPQLVRNFEQVNNTIFPINVIATMSSGKSTLINALLGQKLMPAKNEACTATITEIRDTDDPHFAAVAYDDGGVVIQKIPELTLEIMEELNSNEKVSRVYAEGNIPFLDARSTALELVDTPGPNNAQNQAHKNTTYRAINNDSNNLILYVLNGTQLSTNDDASLLRYISEQIKKGGKQMHDRFLFVVNKMDSFNPEEENIGNAIAAANRYLEGFGIHNPQLFPCSAMVALNIRTYLADIDIDNLTRSQERALPSAARDSLPLIDKLIEYPNMHLEQYSTLTPSAQQQLNFRLQQAIANNDTKEQALIHSGICSIEAAITAYVKKYAKTKKIKDLVESFRETLVSNQVLETVKSQVASNAAAAKELEKKAAAIREKIADGKEAKVFKQKIDAINPIPAITESAEQLKNETIGKAEKVFDLYPQVITEQDEAKRLVKHYTLECSNAMAELTAELESLINQKVIETGNQLLIGYQKKLAEFDDSVINEHLNFETVELVKGELATMKEEVESWTSDDFATDSVDQYGTTTYDTRTYYEKVGEEPEERIVGSHQEKVGTKKVKTGSHKERVGTRQVPNPEKRWWKIFTPKYITEDVYKDVEDYKDEDIFETVYEYETVMKEIFEERTETIKKFSVETAQISNMLITKTLLTLDKGIKSALDYAEKQVQQIKDQFSNLFAKLDQIILSKYKELENCASNQAQKEANLKESLRLQEWIETNIQEINSILDL